MSAFNKAITCIALCALSTVISAETISGKVVAVKDGDTIVVLDEAKTQHTIRLAGIDAPEKKQAFGQRSKESLSDLLFGKPVSVETSKRDKYQREIGKVLVAGLDANLEQIKRGMAWHYKAYEREQLSEDRNAYAVAEVAARTERTGLWSDAYPIPPWDYRHPKK